MFRFKIQERSIAGLRAIGLAEFCQVDQHSPVFESVTDPISWPEGRADQDHDDRKYAQVTRCHAHDGATDLLRQDKVGHQPILNGREAMRCPRWRHMTECATAAYLPLRSMQKTKVFSPWEGPGYRSPG